MVETLDDATDAHDITEHLREQLARRLADQGQSARMISRHVKASYNTVGIWIERQRAAGPDEIGTGDIPTLLAQIAQVDADAQGQQRARRSLVLQLLEAGVTGKQLAAQLAVSNHTVAKWADKARAERFEMDDL
ncbi:hypothetical protein GCM10025867_46190 (plasmid) [Frondihabitans sucicola]|uniref:Helix-turn-helix domain-containing protein n=1 Tax=Frondihabitans sucicola TaxID=1268041 RepID=A0ABM8GV75_9MICO|nr:helix-turn-helix domain-containing protein [Frondihabitans sucicola]BDZ52378.1 hypothetical protein GCM10025867_46190 [Frondihabitans sucicola]